MSNLSILYAFLGGAIVGSAAAVLLAPEKGETTRRKIKELLQQKGILCTDNEIDALVEKLTTEIEEQ